MKKYHAVCYPGDSSDHAWDVQLVQNWQDGQYLPAIAVGCSEANAKRIADCLNACEGVLAENLDVNKLVEDHALLKIKYNNLRCDGLGHLRRAVDALGACPATDHGSRVWRDANAWLALQG